jgi:hypothetical protein
LVRIDHVGGADLDGGRRLELTDYYSAPANVSNLRCYGPLGELWQAELGEPSGGHYVAFETDGDRILANSWDCYLVELDRDTGKILSKTFTK